MYIFRELIDTSTYLKIISSLAREAIKCFSFGHMYSRRVNKLQYSSRDHVAFLQSSPSRAGKSEEDMPMTTAVSPNRVYCALPYLIHKVFRIQSSISA
jgi:hypothetical protein